MFKLERSPTALFDFLKLRSLGQLPQDMQEFVQPTLDMTSFILETNRQSQTTLLAGGVIAAPGLLSSYTTTQPWLVTNIQGVSISAGAGDLGLLAITARWPDFSPPMYVAHRQRWGSIAQMTAAAAGEVTVTELVYPFQPFFLPAGSLIEVYASVVTGGPVCGAYAQYYALS